MCLTSTCNYWRIIATFCIFYRFFRDIIMKVISKFQTLCFCPQVFADKFLLSEFVFFLLSLCFVWLGNWYCGILVIINVWMSIPFYMTKFHNFCEVHVFSHVFYTIWGYMRGVLFFLCAIGSVLLLGFKAGFPKIVFAGNSMFRIAIQGFWATLIFGICKFLHVLADYTNIYCISYQRLWPGWFAGNQSSNLWRTRIFLRDCNIFYDSYRKHCGYECFYRFGCWRCRSFEGNCSGPELSVADFFIFDKNSDFHQYFNF